MSNTTDGPQSAGDPERPSFIGEPLDDQEAQSSQHDPSETIIAVAILLTFIYVLAIGYFSLQASWMTVTHNSLGDYLAGAFAPLAFGWFIVTVFLQRLELRETRKELRNQSKVMKKQFQAMDRQAIYLEQTADADLKDQLRYELAAAPQNGRVKMNDLRDFLSELRITSSPRSDAELPLTQNRFHSDRVFADFNPISEEFSPKAPQAILEFCRIWMLEHAQTFGTLWECLEASNEEWRITILRNKAANFFDWFDDITEKARISDNMVFSEKCREIGINDMRSSLVLMDAMGNAA